MTMGVNGQEIGRVLWADIDGTIRKGYQELGKFVNGPGDVEVFSEIPPILKAYQKAGWRLCGVSNQGGVALGHLTLGDVMDGMAETLRQTGVKWDTLMTCPHHPESKGAIDTRDCWCRKPRIGLVVESALQLSRMTNDIYPPTLSLFIGDRYEDRDCAVNAGIPFMWAKAWREGGWRKHLEESGNE